MAAVARTTRTARVRLHLAGLSVAATFPAWTILPKALSSRAADFLQFTDQAVQEMQVLHATRALHLLGPYSRYHFNHPGPLFYYLLAPLYALSGHATRSIWLTTWVLATGSIAGTVAVVGRVRGRSNAALVSVLLAWQVTCFGPENLCDPWGPYVVVFPFQLFAFVCAAIATGDTALLWLATFVGSFVVQTDVATLPAVAAMLAAAVGCALWGSCSPSPGATAPRWRRAILWALSCAAVVWTPSLVEELGTKPGNLTKLYSFFAEAQDHHTIGDVFAAVAPHVTAVLGVDPEHRLHASESAVHAPESRAAISTLALFALLVVSTITARWGTAATRRQTACGALVTAAGAGAVMLGGTHATGPLMSYLFMWTAGIGTLAVAMVLCTAADVARTQWEGSAPWMGLSAHRVVLPSAFMAATAALLRARTEIPDVPYFYGRPAAEVRALSRAMEAYLRSEHVVAPIARVGAEPAWGMMAAALLELYKDDVAFSVEDGWLFMFGPEFRATRRADVYWVFGDPGYEALARDAPGCALLAESNGTYVFASPTADHPEMNDVEPDEPCP